QAEDGIRDRNVTGVQTCALPISNHKTTNTIAATDAPGRDTCCSHQRARRGKNPVALSDCRTDVLAITRLKETGVLRKTRWPSHQIGRASCRERAEISESMVGVNR